MSDWTEGYIADVNYTFGYYPELNPVRLAIPFLNAGLRPPEIETACELGFGHGVSINLHAAASAASWYGTDFNPGQAAFARSLAAELGDGAQLFDESFAEFCGRGDLPDFDYIGLHGVWSWISGDNQQIIVDFIRRKLKPGGVAYVSYNCLPGHSATLPLRHLLADHAEIMTASGRGTLARIAEALEFAERLLALNPGFAVANPTLGERLKRIKGQDRLYVAHEYFNRDWHATAFADMAKTLAAAKLGYAGSAGYFDHIDPLNLTTDQQRFIAEIPDPIFRQSVRDCMVNQQFRRDYWVKGARRLSPIEQGERLRAQQVILTSPRREIVLTATGALGPREMAPRVYEPILDVLADGQVYSVGDIERAVKPAELTLAAICEAVMVLAGKGDLAPVQEPAMQQRARAPADAFNRHATERARASNEVQFLASPVTGGGVPVPRFHQLFLLARRLGRTTAEELAQGTEELLASHGERLLKDGKPLDDRTATLDALSAQAAEFVERRLPVLQALQVA